MRLFRPDGWSLLHFWGPFGLVVCGWTILLYLGWSSLDAAAIAGAFTVVLVILWEAFEETVAGGLDHTRRWAATIYGWSKAWGMPLDKRGGDIGDILFGFGGIALAGGCVWVVTGMLK